MSVANPAHVIARWSVVGMEAMWVKMFDPPTVSPATPDKVAPTNPVPEVMAAAGFQSAPSIPHTVHRDLMHGLTIQTWDNRPGGLEFFTFRDEFNPSASGGNFPGATIRVPRGVVFHCETYGHGQTPHTIHWHGIEPTPINDGVGHTSMEIGDYTYQFQPNFIGTYFYHCHRNTMQHFEFGLYGMLIIDPPDAFFATQWDPTIPIGCGRDRKRRTAANLSGFPGRFPDFVAGDIREADPEAGNPDPAFPKFATNPHAMTVAYDVEALWVFDDRDSAWSDLADHAHQTFPKHGNVPGVDDRFDENPGSNGFFAFNDFNADYWFITGVPLPAPKYGEASIPPALVVPAALNSGVSGQQVSINAAVNTTILVRCLNAAYNATEITFPVDVVIIAWDGRALGVAPHGFNEAYEIPAHTPIRICTARRFDALIRSSVPVNDVAIVKFINNRGEKVDGIAEDVVFTGKIPITISSAPVLTLTSNLDSPQPVGGTVNFTVTVNGGTPPFEYRFWLYKAADESWTEVQGYGASDTWTMPAGTAAGSYVVAVDARSNPEVYREAVTYLSYEISLPPASSVTIAPDKPAPGVAGEPVVFTATAGAAGYQYRFWLYNSADASWTMVQDYGVGAAWTMPSSTPVGDYVVAVDVRANSSSYRDTVGYFSYSLNATGPAGPATGVTITPEFESPHAAPVTFTAAGQGSSGYQYRFWLYKVADASWTEVQAYGAGSTWQLPLGTDPGDYVIAVDVRTSSAVYRDEVQYLPYTVQ